MNLRLLLFIAFLLGVGGWFVLTPDGGNNVEVVQNTVSTTPSHVGFVIFALIIALVILGLMIWQRAHVLAATRRHPKVAIFVAWTVVIYVAAVTLHPETQDWLLTMTGFGLLLLLIAVVVVLCLGVEILKDSWITVLVFVLLTIAVVDPGILAQMPPEFKALFKAPNFGDGAIQNASVNECPTSPGALIATSQPQWVVPNGARVNATFTVLCGTVRLDGAGGYMDIDPTGVVEKNISPGWRAVTVRSLTPTATFIKQLTPG